MKYPQTQNEAMRLADVSAFAYIVGVIAFLFAGADSVVWSQVVFYSCSLASFAISAYGFFVCFKAKKQLKASGKWAKLSFKQMWDLHWWHKEAA